MADGLITVESKGDRSPKWYVFFLCATVSGALMGCCFWPLNWHFLGWVALAPFLLLFNRMSERMAFWAGTILGIVYYRISLGWLIGLVGPTGAVAVVGLAVFMGIAFLVGRLLVRYLGGWSMVWVAPFVFVGQEILRAESLDSFRFAYGVWGYSQTHNPPVRDLAGIGGVYFVSFVLVMFNAALAYGLQTRKRQAYVPLILVLTGALILIFISDSGAVEKMKSVPVACVQSELDDEDDYLGLVQEALESETQPVFVVLPEHTVYYVVNENDPFIKALGELSDKHDAYICVGAYYKDEDKHNAAIILGPEGRMIGWQAKSIAIPFFTDDYTPARQQHIFPSEHGPFGVYVCYDAGFTDITRRLADRGAEVFLGPVMNPEHWPQAQRQQQADMQIFRSIETGRGAVRAASSGISQIVNPDGIEIARRTQEQGEGILYGSVEMNSEKTIFMKWGYLFNHIVGWIYLIGGPLVLAIHFFSSDFRKFSKMFRQKQGVG